MFRLKWVADKQEKTLGILCRLFGIDLSLLLLGAWEDWRIIDLRLPCNNGLFLQFWFIVASVGRMNDTIYVSES